MHRRTLRRHRRTLITFVDADMTASYMLYIIEFNSAMGNVTMFNSLLEINLTPFDIAWFTLIFSWIKLVIVNFAFKKILTLRGLFLWHFTEQLLELHSMESLCTLYLDTFHRHRQSLSHTINVFIASVTYLSSSSKIFASEFRKGFHLNT